MKNKWKLPNGEYTSDAKKMSKAWKDIYEPICKATGSTVIGFDPSILFKHGSYKSFDLPTDVAIRFSDMIKALKLVVKQQRAGYDTIEICKKAITNQ